jgi:hypothetical protein
MEISPVQLEIKAYNLIVLQFYRAPVGDLISYEESRLGVPNMHPTSLFHVACTLILL